MPRNWPNTAPSLNAERRRELTKQVQKRGEETRVAVRNVRREAMNDLREMEKESMITEDDLKSGEKEVQEKTDEYIKQVDAILQKKEKEIMTV